MYEKFVSQMRLWGSFAQELSDPSLLSNTTALGLWQELGKERNNKTKTLGLFNSVGCQ